MDYNLRYYTSGEFNKWPTTAFVIQFNANTWICGSKPNGYIEPISYGFSSGWAQHSNLNAFRHHLQAMSDANCFTKAVGYHFFYFLEVLKNLDKSRNLHILVGSINAGEWISPEKYNEFSARISREHPDKQIKLKYVYPTTGISNSIKAELVHQDPIQYSAALLD